MADPPDTFHGVKFPVSMKKTPITDTTARAANFKTVVITCTDAMLLTPLRLITPASNNPTSAMRMSAHLPSGEFSPALVSRYSTYSTQPVTMAALPAHAVIQYDQALKNPIRLPNAARAYAYGPPAAGVRATPPA